MIDNWLTATRSADTYPTTEWQNDVIASCVMEERGCTREDAWQFLHSDVMLPSSSKPPWAKRGVHKYLLRSIDYFYSAIASTSQRVYLKTLLEKRHRGVTREPTNEAETRFTIKISATEAARLVSDNTLIHDHSSFDAVKEATVAVFRRFHGGSTFIKPSPYRGVKPDLVCLLGHIAVVSTKIEEYLKRVAGKATSAINGINPGHREPWRLMLSALDSALSQGGETRNRLRLVDGDRADRGQAPEDTAGDQGTAPFSRLELDPDETGSAGTADGGAVPEVEPPARVGALTGGSAGGLGEPHRAIPIAAGGRPVAGGPAGAAGPGLAEPSGVGQMPVGGPPVGPTPVAEWSLGLDPPAAAPVPAVELPALGAAGLVPAGERPTPTAHPSAGAMAVTSNWAPAGGQAVAPARGWAPAGASPAAVDIRWASSDTLRATSGSAPAAGFPPAGPLAAEGDAGDSSGHGRVGGGRGAGER